MTADGVEYLRLLGEQVTRLQAGELSSENLWGYDERLNALWRKLVPSEQDEINRKLLSGKTYRDA